MPRWWDGNEGEEAPEQVPQQISYDMYITYGEQQYLQSLGYDYPMRHAESAACGTIRIPTQSEYEVVNQTLLNYRSSQTPTDFSGAVNVDNRLSSGAALQQMQGAYNNQYSQNQQAQAAANQQALAQQQSVYQGYSYGGYATVNSNWGGATMRHYADPKDEEIKKLKEEVAALKAAYGDILDEDKSIL